MKLTVKGFKKVNNADTNTVEDKSIINIKHILVFIILFIY